VLDSSLAGERLRAIATIQVMGEATAGSN